jgi:hypothetical protein
MSWEPLCWAALGERPPVTPSIGGLVYPGRRHVFSGPPESCKTWAALVIGVEEIRRGGIVFHVDFEMFGYETRDRLRSMGVTDDELERFLHIEPEHPGSEAVVGDVIDRYKPTLAIIDAAAGAYSMQGLDDNARQDVETFSRAIIEPFRVRGVATVLLDHVTKNRDTRGGFSIGSERKVGGADVHLGFEMVTPFGRGRVGLAKIVTHKDRFGYLPRPTTAELELRSDADGRVTWTFNEADGTNDWAPTLLMERVSLFLEAQTGPVSRNVVEQNVSGKAKYVREAMDTLVRFGNVAERAGERRSRLLDVLEPYRTTTSSLRPDFVPETTSSLVPRLQAGTKSKDELNSDIDGPVEEMDW